MLFVNLSISLLGLCISFVKFYVWYLKISFTRRYNSNSIIDEVNAFLAWSKFFLSLKIIDKNIMWVFHRALRKKIKQRFLNILQSWENVQRNIVI